MRKTLPLTLLSICLIATPAGAAEAKGLRAYPKSQTIKLGQGAQVKVKSQKRCRLVAGISKKQVRAKQRGGRFILTIKPRKVGLYKLRIKCAAKTAKASLKVISNTGGDGGSQTPDSGLPSGSDPTPEPRSTSRLGTNAAEVNYYNGATPFSNLMMQAGDWLDSFAARADGYPQRLNPGQVARVAIAEANYPSGVYKISWQGSGSFRVGNQSFSGEGGQGEVSLDGQSLIMLTIEETDPTNPLRAIKVQIPGEEGTFYSRYLSQLTPYGIIRFMDWQRTNSLPRTLTCQNRPGADSYSQGGEQGASIEMMIALSNQTGSDPWFTIPHSADNSWVICLGEIVKERLRQDLTPRFELSNETWNPIFPQYQALEAAGAGLGGRDSYLGLQRAHAIKHKQVMGLIKEAMGSRAMIRVMAGQAANSWVMEQRMDYGGAQAQVDEIALAPYLGQHEAFDPAEAERISRLSQAQLFGELEGKLSGEVSRWISDHVSLASRYNKPIISYEGGQHLAGDQSNQALTQLFTQANRSQRMGEIYDSYFQAWNRLTQNAPFVHFTDVGPCSQYGCWGALESSQQSPDSSPKYQALKRQAER